MKHKVKLVRVVGEIMTVKVDGVLCSYLIQCPQPLDLRDSNLLQSVMDASLMESLVRCSGLVGPSRRWRLLEWLGNLWPRRSRLPLFSMEAGETVAAYIGKVGVEVNIDKKTKGVVILKSDVDKIRKGNV